MVSKKENNPRYGIGEQDFGGLRERDCIYVDKTQFIKGIVTSGPKYYFLARPRRFGKSLFLSTLRYFFEGRRELFKGLYIDTTDWDWAEYPVLRLDLNTDRYSEQGKLEVVLDNLFNQWESKYSINNIASDYSQRFNNIIRIAHERTGKEVVILVDEYDKPLVGNLNKEDNFEHYRSKLASLYSNFKSSAEHIKLVFLTGVSRFSKLSVFSDLNNIRDITFDNEYADICGITEKELLEYFQVGIERLAKRERTDYDGAIRMLKRNYDGYRFAEEGSEIYNPWSLLNAMQESKIGNYWNDTGMPTLVAESLKRVGADLEKTFDSLCEDDDLKGLDLLNPNPRALLYQTGYLTIKKYIRSVRKYRLGIPNREVKKGLFNVLLPYYVQCKSVTPKMTVSGIVTGFILGDPQEAMLCMQSYFAGIDFKMRIDNENNFHNAFYLLMDLIGLDTETEVHTSDGSIDMKVETEDYIYIIELKYDHTAEEALQQIKDKQYARPWHNDNREIILIGASFSSSTRCIEDWKIEKIKR
ncbi:MAG: ATP-binding protein [Muribaculaceae bacterium]|nr:ATP-binding protein [Muribaculaceae bacterium]